MAELTIEAERKGRRASAKLKHVGGAVDRGEDEGQRRPERRAGSRELLP
jgi:hypothetical protein